MAVEFAKFFSPDPTQARSLKGLDIVSLFNDNVIGAANSFSPEDDLDLDGEDAAASERRFAFDRNDEQRSFSRRREDEAFLASMNGGGSPTVPTTPQGFDYAADEDDVPLVSRSAPASSGPPAAYEGPRGLIDFVKKQEGFYENAYGDYKQTSIGYGTRARKGEKSITREAADARLRSELAAHRKRVVDHAAKHGYDFSPGQLDALTSFDFNTGRLEQLTNNGTRDVNTIGQRMGAYNKAGGKVLPGLVKRRSAEQSLFNNG